MDDAYDSEVSAVLLYFGRLDKAQRIVFADQFNQFLYGSPQQQRQLMEQWWDTFRDSKSPSVKMICESPAKYTARRKKSRK
jgi:hypothetical protein